MDFSRLIEMVRYIFCTLIIAAWLSGCSTTQFDPTAWKNRVLASMNISPANPSSRSSNSHVENLKTSENECVVLVHGLWRSAFAMRSIENYLAEKGFQTENISYPSTEGSIFELANTYLSPAVENCKRRSDTVHIVTHSMGGVLAHAYLQQNRLGNGGKVVMLSPPAKGSELAKEFKDNAFVAFIVGDAAMTLHQGHEGVLKNLSEFPEPLGVIAGYRNWSLWPESLLPAPNDGMVSLQSMIISGLDDLILINTGHAMMRYNDEVKIQILNYLKTGQFQHASKES